MAQDQEDRVPVREVAGDGWVAPDLEPVRKVCANARHAATPFPIREAALATISPVPSAALRWSEDSLHG
jgi:hypothetical protein